MHGVRGGSRPSSGARVPQAQMFALEEDEEDGRASGGRGRSSKSPGRRGRGRYVKSPGRVIGSAAAAAAMPSEVPRIRIEGMAQALAQAETQIESPRGSGAVDILSPRSAFRLKHERER